MMFAFFFRMKVCIELKDLRRSIQIAMFMPQNPKNMAALRKKKKETVNLT